MSDLTWIDMSMPNWEGSNNNGELTARVRVSTTTGKWVWETARWSIDQYGKPIDMLAHGGGYCDGLEDGKAKVQEWLKNNL